MSLPTEIQLRYQQLLEKIANLVSQQRERYAPQILCAPKCASCCRPPGSFFVLEAEILQEAIASLSPQKQRILLNQWRDNNSGFTTEDNNDPQKQRILLNQWRDNNANNNEHPANNTKNERPALALLLHSAEPLCPLLWQQRCLVYEARPIICRTHGYAVLAPPNSHGERLLSWCPLNFRDSPPAPDLAFDLEHLNTLLALLNRLAYPNHSPRRSWEELLALALPDSF